MGSFKLVCFDLDGCLTEKDDSWSFIHRKLGVWEQAKTHRKLFFAGEIDYQKWADLDIALWKETSIDVLNRIIQQIQVRPHIHEIVQQLKKYDLKLMILSSGLSFFADRVKREFNFDHAIANEPKLDERGRLTGEIIIGVSYNDKDEVLRNYIDPLNINLKECIAVGDGENDIPLFKEAGYSIAFNPINDRVADAADAVVRDGNLLKVLELILARL